MRNQSFSGSGSAFIKFIVVQICLLSFLLPPSSLPPSLPPPSLPPSLPPPSLPFPSPSLTPSPSLPPACLPPPFLLYSLPPSLTPSPLSPSLSPALLLPQHPGYLLCQESHPPSHDPPWLRRTLPSVCHHRLAVRLQSLHLPVLRGLHSLLANHAHCGQVRVKLWLWDRRVNTVHPIAPV